MQNTYPTPSNTGAQTARGDSPMPGRHSMSNINVGREERALSLLGGLAILIAGAANQNRLLTMLAAALGGYMVYRGATGHCVAYDAMGMSTAVMTNKMRVSVPHQQGIHVEHSVTVNRPVSEVYTFWRNFENLPRFMNHLESVTIYDGKRSHWVAKGPAGTRVEWDAEIINEIPNEVIGWRSLKDSHVANAGSVRFRPAPGNRGTEVQVSLEYTPPAGPLGAAVAALFGEEPRLQIEDDLRRFKQMMEMGEVPTTDGQPHGG